MSYIGRGLQSGAFRQLDDISSGFDGSDTTHTMQVNSTNVIVGDVNQILLSLGGVIQKPGTDFTVSGSTLTFTTAPAANTSFFAILLGSDNGGTVTPTDGSVTSGKLAYPFVVNEDGAAASDFRVESDSNTHMLFVDAGNNSIGINNSTPGSYDAGADDLVVGDHSVSSQGITIASDDNSILYFADGTSGDEKYRGSIIYNHPADNFTIRTGGFNTRMTIDSTGAVTMPNQPAFLVQPSADQNNIASDAWVTIAFGTEVYDQNADFASNTFTAPVTGKYFLHCQVRSDQPDTASNYIWVKFVTSNRTIYGTLYDLGGLSGDPVYWNMTVSALADMDANDTVTVEVRSSGGTAQLDISTNTHFSGFLAC